MKRLIIKTEDMYEYVDGLINNEVIKAFYLSSILRRTPNMSRQQISEILDEYVDEGLLLKKYEIACIYCYHVLSETYNEDEIRQAEEDDYCMYCDKEIGTDELYIRVAYEVVGR